MAQEVVAEILSQYPFAYQQAMLLRHNENQTYWIDDQYLLRIHQARAGFSTSFFEERTIVTQREHELLFLEHLQRKGLLVQRPVKNTAGQLITWTSDQTAATVLTWLPGRILQPEDITPQLCEALGRLLGTLHQAAADFEGEMICYDEKLCEALIALFAAYQKRGQISRAAFVAMSACLERLGRKLADATVVCVHSDLSLSNLLLTDQGLVPIDFSLAGFSSPLLDFGSLFSFIPDEFCREQLLRGYEKTTGIVIDEQEIADYVALQILLGIMLHIEAWVDEEWFHQQLPQWCSEYFAG